MKKGRNCMVQDYYKNAITSSSILYFHKPDKDLKMDFTLDPNGKGVSGGRFGKVWLEDAEPTIKILDNGDVRFRYYAPEAQKVEVAGCGGYFSDEKVAMTKGEDGWWSCVISGIKPGFHNHKYWVDGNLMVNPDAPVGYGWFYPINVFDLPGEEDGFWMLKDVPHGDVRMEYYKSSATGRTKLAWVYTPAGYDESDKRYPVLYIQHGVGENEMGWVWQGHINMIADNLIAEGKMEEMIIVMNCGYAFVEGENPVFLPGDFSKELTEDCIPHIDAEYRTIADRKHRAMAGLSLGSSQAFFIANEHRDLFANLGVFSGGFPIVNTFGYWDYTDYYNDPEQVNKDFDVLFISGGDDEGYPERTAPVVEAEQKLGVNVIGYHHPGFHVWDVWRFSAREFMQRIFK
ncbi:MAG: hypothetical protein IKX09_02200 [Oscillospiraceae bacterium]|nr:hypothetical protein [Oscillospiraceae bacterium]